MMKPYLAARGFPAQRDQHLANRRAEDRPDRDGQETFKRFLIKRERHGGKDDRDDDERHRHIGDAAQRRI